MVPALVIESIELIQAINKSIIKLTNLFPQRMIHVIKIPFIHKNIDY